MMRRGSATTRLCLLAICIALAAACGVGSEAASTATIAQTSSTSGQLCEPGPSIEAGVAEVAEGRRGEALVEYLTGIDELALQENQEGIDIVYDDPNYGGVWGDFAGGWVVAVLDCTQVDLDQVARIAGGPEAVRIIEVSHTFEQVNEFRDGLATELQSKDLQADLLIDSTLTGRRITMIVEDLDQVPDGFGNNVPTHLFSIEEGGLFTPD